MVIIRMQAAKPVNDDRSGYLGYWNFLINCLNNSWWFSFLQSNIYFYFI